MKTQAETAARIFWGKPDRLEKGSVIPDLELFFADGSRQLLSEFRGRSNLVIIFRAESQDVLALLRDLSAETNTIRSNESKALVIETREQIAAGAQQSTFPIAHALSMPRLPAVPPVIITDRFGEIFAALPNANSPAIPSADEVVRWLEFINQQCEECSPPEWPE